MDSERDVEAIKFKRYPTIECQYFESNTSRVVVNTVNPYNTVGGYRTRITRKNNNVEINDVLDNSIKTPYTGTSNGLIREIMQDYEINTDVYVHEHKHVDNFTCPTDQLSDSSGSQHSFDLSTRPFNTPDNSTSCSRSLPKTSFRKRTRTKKYNFNSKRKHISPNETFTVRAPNEVQQAEKTTYCRPVNNMYNEKFFYKTMQRNARLQNIVRQLVIARQKEKQKESWNNYINELKNKHGYCNDSTGTSRYVPDDRNTFQFISDHCNINPSWLNSAPARNLINDFYGECSNVQPNDCYKYPRNIPPQNRRQYFENNSCCYPTSSQGSLMMLNNGLLPEHLKKYFIRTPIIIGKYSSRMQGMTDKYPSRMQDMTDKYPSRMQDMTDKYPSRMQDMNDKYPSRMQDMADKYPNRMLDMADKYPNRMLDMTDKYPNGMQDMTGKYPNHMRDEELSSGINYSNDAHDFFNNEKNNIKSTKSMGMQTDIKLRNISNLGIVPENISHARVYKKETSTLANIKSLKNSPHIRASSSKKSFTQGSSYGHRRRVSANGIKLGNKICICKLLKNLDINELRRKANECPCHRVQNKEKDISIGDMASHRINSAELKELHSSAEYLNINGKMATPQVGESDYEQKDGVTEVIQHDENCACVRLQNTNGNVAKLQKLDCACKCLQRGDSNHARLLRMNCSCERIINKYMNTAMLTVGCNCKRLLNIDSKVDCACKHSQIIDRYKKMLNQVECTCKRLRNINNVKVECVCKNWQNIDKNQVKCNCNDSLKIEDEKVTCSCKHSLNIRDQEIECACTFKETVNVIEVDCACKQLLNTDDVEVECTCKNLQTISNKGVECACKDLQRLDNEVECLCRVRKKIDDKKSDCACKRLLNVDDKDVDCTCKLTHNIEDNQVECACKRVKIKSGIEIDNEVECLCRVRQKKDNKELECACKRLLKEDDKEAECACKGLLKENNKKVECACESLLKVDNKEVDCACMLNQNIEDEQMECACKRVKNTVDKKGECACKKVKNIDCDNVECACKEVINIDSDNVECACKSLQTIDNGEVECACKTRLPNRADEEIECFCNHPQKIDNSNKVKCSCTVIPNIESKKIECSCKNFENIEKDEVTCTCKKLELLNIGDHTVECSCVIANNIDGIVNCDCKYLQNIDNIEVECACKSMQDIKNIFEQLIELKCVCINSSVIDENEVKCAYKRMEQFDNNFSKLTELKCACKRVQYIYSTAAKLPKADCACEHFASTNNTVTSTDKADDCVCKYIRNINNNIVKLKKVICPCEQFQNEGGNEENLQEEVCISDTLQNIEGKPKVVICTNKQSENFDRLAKLMEKESPSKHLQNSKINAQRSLQKVKSDVQKPLRNEKSNVQGPLPKNINYTPIPKSKYCECEPCKQCLKNNIQRLSQTVKRIVERPMPTESVRESFQMTKANVLSSKQKDCECKSLRDIERTVITTVEKTTAKPLQNIENKLDNLIASFNAFVKEMRDTKCYNTKIRSPSVVSVSDELNSTTSKPVAIETHSNTSRLFKTDQVLYTTVARSPARKETISDIDPNMIRIHRNFSNTKIENIIKEEMEKSNKIKRDIKELLHTGCDGQCSVEISFDIPTKEVSTAITSSSCRTQNGSESQFGIEEITTPIRSEDRSGHRMAIAVNTDPLGFLALLRISADTLKQLLSYVPQLNYYSCLRSLQPAHRPCAAHYVCNICGASFCRPSQLSDHIERNHDFGRTRDCCVCRHVLDMQNDRIGLFKCKYCGKMFARAYCCELHQQTCARLYGQQHDVAPNLMLLR